MNQESWETKRARTLRRELTPAEKILWKALRGRRFDGLKCRRQYPLLPYVVDFYCFEIKLAIEIDGETHLDKEANDERRQNTIEAQGIKVLRFWNTEVYDELDSVLEAIWRECETRKNVNEQPSLPPSPPAPLPGGEGSR